MNIKIVKGKNTDKNIQKCYDFLINIYKRDAKTMK